MKPSAQHAAASSVTMYRGFGALFLGLGGLGLWAGGTFLFTWAVPFFGLGASCIALGRFMRRSLAGVQLVNPAADCINNGDLQGAEALLAQAEKNAVPHVKRVIQVQRTAIAWRRGEVGELLRLANEALSVPPSLLNRGSELDSELRALRALGYACTGKVDQVAEDVQYVRRAELSTARAMARAELAHALVLERRGERAALWQHFRQERSLLLEGNAPGERALVRAMERMLRAPTKSAYRTPPPTTTDQDATTHQRWLARVAPEAAPYASPTHRADVSLRAPGSRPATSRSVDLPAPSSHSPKATPVPAQKESEARIAPSISRRREWLGLLTLWVVVILMWAGALHMLGWPQEGPEVSTTSFPFPSLLWLPLPILLALGIDVALFMLRVRRARAEYRALSGAQVDKVRGHDEAARAAFEKAATSRFPVLAAQAELELGLIAESEARWKRALYHCERGITLATKNQAAYVASSDLVLPELAGLRAQLLLTTGRVEEAGAKLAALKEQFPSFAHVSRVVYVFELVRLVTAGSVAEAAQLADRFTEAAVTLRYALLADLARAVGKGVRPEEALRLSDELRDDDRSRQWVTRLAPDLVAEFHRLHREQESTACATAEEQEALAQQEEAAEAEAAVQAMPRALR